MNSGGLGLVNAAVNSLLGSMNSNSTQQKTSDHSFNQIFDKKMQYSNTGQMKRSDISRPEQVNREKTTANDAEYENDREAYVKSDMQRPKKPIEKMAKEKVSAVSDNKKVEKDQDMDDTEAIEAVETEVVDETEAVDDEKVLKELMALLGNDQMTDEEQLKSINDWLESLTDTELKVFENEAPMLKSLLLSVNGSLEGFGQTLSQMKVNGESFTELLKNVDLEEGLSIEGLALHEPEAVDLTEKVNLEEMTTTPEADDLEAVEEVVANKIAAVEKVDETPKETKAEQLKAAAEKTERVVTGAEINADSSSSKNTQQQTTADSNQSFSESLKFHTATVKTAAMKGTVASNPFEEKIMQQVIKGTQVSMNVGKDVSEMMIKLNPKDLGNVSLKISLKNEQLVAEFNVENKTVKEVLESRLEDLKTALSDKGFTIEGLDVSVNQDANDQFRSYEEFIKQQKGKKKFDGIEGVDSVEGLEETGKTAQWQSLETTSSEINVLA